MSRRPTAPLRLVAAAALATAIALPAFAATAHAKPWRLSEHLGTDRVSIQVQHRIRYERLENQFRANLTGNDQSLSIRTLVHGRWKATERLTLGVEFIDSRGELDDDGSLVNTTIVNSTELLQAYAELSGTFRTGDYQLRLGRMTTDYGSRRLIARNRFRNTINAFTGVEWNWSGADGENFRAFYLLPVRRLPTEFDRLRDNESEFDEESFDVQFLGLHYTRKTPWGDHAEGYVYGLLEDDGPGIATRDRRLATPGFRIWRKPAPGAFDYTIETALQFGESKSSSRDDATNLDHFAHFHHAEVGYTFDVPWSPRAVLQWDYASGDDDPTDEQNGRFDSLFGGRRFDYHPTGIFGPVARSNLHTPGLRLIVRPLSNVSSFVNYRPYWLARDRDAWVVARASDPTGRTSSFLGHMFDMRVRWEVLPGNLRLEAGYTHFSAGSFRRDFPGETQNPDFGRASNYFYTQFILSF